MLTGRAEAKFNELLKRIRNNDKAFLQKQEGDYFEDDDFQEAKSKAAKVAQKITYKDVIRRDALEKIADGNADSGDSEDERVRGSELFKKHAKETIAEEEARIKAEFKKAAAGSDDSGNHGAGAADDASSDDDILVKKAKVDDSSSGGEEEVRPKKSEKGREPLNF